MSTYYTEAKKQIEALLLSRQTVLCSGGAKDFPDYRRITGEISGLNLSIRELNDLQERLEKHNGDIEDSS